MFASWLGDQFFGGIGWLILFAAGIHLLAKWYGDRNPVVKQEASHALQSGFIKAIRWFIKK
jgi:hypothetical protein